MVCGIKQIPLFKTAKDEIPSFTRIHPHAKPRHSHVPKFDEYGDYQTIYKPNASRRPSVCGRVSESGRVSGDEND